MNYVVFCYPRTGSTLLCNFLMNHPSLGCGMEIFGAFLNHPQEISKWRKEKFYQLFDNKNVTKFENQEYLLNFNNFEFSTFLESVFDKYKGFKLISSHIPHNSSLWNRLLSQDVKFILLERNVVDACCSFELAKETKIWHKTKENLECSYKQKSISQKDADWFWEQYIEPYSQISKQIKNKCKYLEINYNTLTNKWEETLVHIQKFLEVPNFYMDKTFQKLVPYNYTELISNYQQICQLYFNKRKIYI